MTIETIVNQQRTFFLTHQSIPVSFRIQQLKRLHQQIIRYEDDILKALKEDLNKNEFEAYATEIGMVYNELKYMLRNIHKLTKKKDYASPIMHFPSKSMTYQDPYGCVLIMSPWNYPFQLTMTPLIGAIAAGNCVVVKPSNDSSATTRVIREILSVFPDEYICLVEGGRNENQALLDQKFDYIFFTGSPKVGKIVMEKAAKNLTPITLELGGKSPCIVEKSADIDLAAKRIVWGKLLNAAQTCVAPDYLWVQKDVCDQLIEAMKKYADIFYTSHPELNKDYPKIINQHHFERLCRLVKDEALVNTDTRQIGLTIIKDVSWDSEVMQEELFGPILPVMCFESIEEVITTLNTKEKPLALYLFTTSKSIETKLMKHSFFGGGCVNDVIIHVANHHIPFGGIGNSGLGSYHGAYSFHTFSHTKSIMKKSNLLDLSIRYAPASKFKLWVVRKLLSK
ncbi:MAG: aldehyde dehydrogenase [Erysipelotrichaceae bacterium]